MLRRFAALAGIILILAVVTALAWTVHQHKTDTVPPTEGAVDVISFHSSPTPNEETL